MYLFVFRSVRSPVGAYSAEEDSSRGEGERGSSATLSNIVCARTFSSSFAQIKNAVRWRMLCACLTGGFSNVHHENCHITVLKLPGRYLAGLWGVLGAVVVTVVSCQILAR